VDDFRRRLAGDGPVHLVLHGLEKPDADRLGSGRNQRWWRRCR
jgi:hypothetical protein